MANYRGMDGSVTFNAGLVGEVKAWNATVNGEVLDTTSMGLKWRTVKGGVGQWSGQITCQLDYGDVAQKAMVDSLIAASPTGTPIAAELLFGTTKKITGSILVTSIAFAQALGAIVEVTLSFEGSGVPTISWA